MQQPNKGMWAIFLAAFVTLSCSKDKLPDEFGAFKGMYDWRSTGLVKGPVLSQQHDVLYPSDVSYTVSFELNDQGEALFYKNNELISKSAFSIRDKESNEYGGKEIIIKLRGDLKGLNIPEEKLKLNLTGDTALSIDKFPFPAIEEASNYKPDYRSLGNDFRRK